ncbi:MAG: hypothetical protein WA751_10085 [Candidatus Dormiibacterota bacterium]
MPGQSLRTSGAPEGNTPDIDEDIFSGRLLVRSAATALEVDLSV